MKKRSLALLLSAAMVVSQLGTTGTRVLAEDFSSEPAEIVPYEGDSFSDGGTEDFLENNGEDGEVPLLTDDGEEDAAFTDSEGEEESTWTFHYPLSDRTYISNEWFFVSGTFTCWGRNQGEEEDYLNNCQVLDVTSSNGNICEVSYEEDGWVIWMSNTGNATISITFMDPSSAIHNKNFQIEVAEDRYESDFVYDSGTDQMIKNGSKSISTSLCHYVYNSETGNPDCIEVTDYRIVLENYDESFFTARVDEQNNSIIVTSKEQEGGAFIPVQFLVGETVVSEEVIWVNVVNGFYDIDQSSLRETQLYVGESTTVKPVLKYYSSDNPNGEIVDNVEYGWEYNPEAVTIEGDEESEFRVTKLKNRNERIRLIATVSDENGTAYPEKEWWLNEQDYNLWFEDNYEEENQNYVLAGKDRTFELNTEKLSGKEFKIKWEVGFCFDEEGNIAIFPDAYESNHFGQVTIHGDALKKMFPYDREQRFRVCAKIMAGNEEVSRTEMDVEYRDTIKEFYFCGCQDGDTMYVLPRWEQWIDKECRGFIRNSDFPEGSDVSATVTNVSVQSDGESIVRVEKKEDSWIIIPEKTGDAILYVEYEYKTPEGDTIPEDATIYISVGTDTYGVRIASSTNTNVIRPGESIDLTAYVKHDYYLEDEDRHYSDEGENVTVEWRVSESGEYAEIKPDPNNKVTVTAYDNSNGRDIVIVADVIDQERNVLASEEFRLSIRDEYHEIVINGDEEVLTPELQINKSIELTPELKLVTQEGEKEPVEQEVQYFWEWDENAFEIKDAGGNRLGGDNRTGKAPFTITRKGNWDTDINLIAELPDEDGNWQEAARKSWTFKRQDYNISFSNMRGQDYTWVYSDETYQMDLNIEGIDDDSAAFYKEIVVGYQREGTDVTPVSDVYSVQDNTLTLNGKALKETELPENSWWAVQVRLKSDEDGNELANYGMGFDVRDPWYEIGLYDGMRLVPGDQIAFSGKGTGIGIENQYYPNWAETQLTVTKITSTDPNAVQVEMDQDGNWSVTAIKASETETDITVQGIYLTPDDSEVEFKQTYSVQVLEEFYEIVIDSSTNTYDMLPGSSLKVMPTVYKYSVGKVEPIPSDQYTLEYDTEDKDQVIIDDDGTIHAHELGEARISVKAKDKDGEFDIEREFYIWITSEYKVWQIEEVLTEPNAILTLSDVNAELMQYDQKNPNGKKLNITPVLSEGRYTDSSLVEISDNGSKITVTGTHLTSKDEPRTTYVRIDTADGEYGNWIPVTVCVHNHEVIKTVYPTCTTTGLKTLQCEKCGKITTQTLGITDHSWSEWKTTTEATVSSPAIQSSYCYGCGTTITRTYGDKLDPSVDPITEAVETEPGKEVTDFKLTGLAKGDEVVSWESSNTDLVTVKGNADGTCEIITKNKTGEAEITVTLKSGLKQTIKVSVAYSIQREEPKIEAVTVTGNKVNVKLFDTLKEASGYDYVISTEPNYTEGRLEDGINKNVPVIKTGYQYLPKGTYYVYCHAWDRIDGKKVFSGWSDIRQFTVTADTPETPVITGVEVKGSTVTVTWKKTKYTEGYDVVLGSAKGKTEYGEKRPKDYGKLVKKNIDGDTVTAVFKNVPKGTYYVGLHAYNRSSESDNKKVFGPWSNMKTVKVK